MSTLLSTIHVLYMMIKHTVRVNFVTLFVTVLTQLSVVTVAFLSNLSDSVQSLHVTPVTPGTRGTGVTGVTHCHWTRGSVWLHCGSTVATARPPPAVRLGKLTETAVCA